MLIPKTIQGEQFFVASNKNEAFGAYNSLREAFQALERFIHWANEKPNDFEQELKQVRFIVKVNHMGKEIVWKLE